MPPPPVHCPPLLPHQRGTALALCSSGQTNRGTSSHFNLETEEVVIKLGNPSNLAVCCKLPAQSSDFFLSEIQGFVCDLVIRETPPGCLINNSQCWKKKENSYFSSIKTCKILEFIIAANNHGEGISWKHLVGKYNLTSVST